jgi:hypothetical protein
MIAEREGLDLESSFLLLRNHASNHNLRLADVATSIITGTTPLPAPSTDSYRGSSARTAPPEPLVDSPVGSCCSRPWQCLLPIADARS